MMGMDKKKIAMMIVKKDSPEKDEKPSREPESESEWVDKGEESEDQWGPISAAEDLISAFKEEDPKAALMAIKHLLSMVTEQEEG